jgi:heat-inducible transcriptional repressor
MLVRLMELSPRAKEVLAAIVREYILEGGAVGSRTLVRRQGIAQSPATIRNVMADLEEHGLLMQPHASAGRIPTESGLRFYVDRLMKARDLSEAEKHEILGRYNISTMEFQRLMRELSRLLSEVSQQCAVVLAPRSNLSVIKRIEFVPIGSDRLLAVLVMSSGLVQNRLLRLERTLESHEIQRVHNYLNDLCANRELTEVRQLVQSELENEQTRYDDLVGKALAVGAELIDCAVEDELLIEGTERLLDLPQADHEQLKGLMRGIEQKRMVLRLLDDTMAAEGVQVFIGAETKEDQLRNCAVVMSAYGGTKPVGMLGVIGPSNMDYPRVVPLVDFTAGLLNKALDRK